MKCSKLIILLILTLIIGNQSLVYSATQNEEEMIYIYLDSVNFNYVDNYGTMLNNIVRSVSEVRESIDIDKYRDIVKRLTVLIGNMDDFDKQKNLSYSLMMDVAIKNNQNKSKELEEIIGNLASMQVPKEVVLEQDIDYRNVEKKFIEIKTILREANLEYISNGIKVRVKTDLPTVMLNVKTFEYINNNGGNGIVIDFGTAVLDIPCSITKIEKINAVREYNPLAKIAFNVQPKQKMAYEFGAIPIDCHLINNISVVDFNVAVKTEQGISISVNNDLNEGIKIKVPLFAIDNACSMIYKDKMWQKVGGIYDANSKEFVTNMTSFGIYTIMTTDIIFENLIVSEDLQIKNNEDTVKETVSFGEFLNNIVNKILNIF